ncbi:tRNA preQ1(34) S-adenosylmethionine ribosyltransferase-isomerase QueA [Algiphilus sp.]|uniref:tRNA preQ1(34) S-adenosylmethionine ribosyltransferase-isomerase QueA n=1 Tax=Algiphilus sp. TaxID=1872431 RepID=UPI003BA9A061
MKRADFHYDLPEALIAQRAVEPRSSARMLCVAPNGPRDAGVLDWPEMLSPHDLLVFNDTRVIPARLYAHKATGGRVEIFLERVLADPQRVQAQMRASKPIRPGTRLTVEGAEAIATVEGRDEEGFFTVAFDRKALPVFEQAGHVPLPPYITRPDEAEDVARYQSIFADKAGAVAAPTASLHFDDAMMAKLKARGIRWTTLTLHVGAGTFAPVRVDDPAAHHMHAERYAVSDALVAEVEAARARGGRVVAVGTTVVRALEGAVVDAGALRPMAGETRLFITPGFRFQVVDALLTNFHLPESTLLMLVSAFAGRERMLAAYRHAVTQRYRFFSYGDAMWIPQRYADSSSAA